MPFTTCAEMLLHDAGRGTPLWKLGAEYEMVRGNLTETEVIAKMVDIVRILRRSIAQGIAGTRYDDHVLGHQSGGYLREMQAGRLLDAGAEELLGFGIFKPTPKTLSARLNADNLQRAIEAYELMERRVTELATKQ